MRLRRINHHSNAAATPSGSRESERTKRRAIIMLLLYNAQTAPGGAAAERVARGRGGEEGWSSQKVKFKAIIQHDSGLLSFISPRLRCRTGHFLLEN